MNRFFTFHIAFAFFLLALLAASDVHAARADPPGATSIPVVFIPGIGGTRLADSENVEYWTAAGYSGHDLLTLYPGTLHPTLYPTNAITEATFLGVHISFEDWQTYGPMFTYLQGQGFIQYQTNQNPYLQTSAGCDLAQASNHPNLFVFAYDWRISNAQNATLLADYIACVQKFYPNTNVNLVAHSMGGLVARRYILENPGTHHVNALVSVASPYIGASKVVWVEETGEYVFFVWASTLLNVVGSFNGASELLNSQAWYDLGGAAPLIEDGQDLNHDGKTNEQFSYPMLVDYMNNAHGKEGFLPGTQNQTFHSYSNGGNNQDNWSNDTTGVKYFHIVGAGLVPDTINQVVATTFWKCLKNITICDLTTWEYPKFTQGDTTVPLLASSRISGTLNYNAPNATLFQCQAYGANNQNVDHTGMLSNPVVQGLVVGYLAQANGGAVVDPPPSLACGQGQTTLQPGGALGQYHHLALSGAREIHVSDGTNDPVPDTVLNYPAGKNSAVLILGSGKKYAITFRAANEPLFLEWLYRDATHTIRAVRYLDTELVPDALTRIVLRDGKIRRLRYDSDNDGKVDTRVKPTADMQDALARDNRPPALKFSYASEGNGYRVTLTASDNASGVARVAYSLDGRHFQAYTGPFTVNASVKLIYAFSDDAAANRSKMHKFKIKP